MKKKTKILLSSFIFLSVLFFLGQMEREKSDNLLKKLASTETQNYVYTYFDFDKIIKDEASPLVVLFKKESINYLTVSKCKLGQIVFLYNNSGKETVYDRFGDAGTISYSLGRGEKLKNPNHKEETIYYQQKISQFSKTFGFNGWKTVFYLLEKILLLLLLTFLPFLVSLKMFLLFIAILIIIISLLNITNNCKDEKLLSKVNNTECFLKKPPPIIEQSYHCHVLLVLDQFIISNNESVNLAVSVKPIFFKKINLNVQKVLRKIFHIPIFYFVLNQY